MAVNANFSEGGGGRAMSLSERKAMQKLRAHEAEDLDGISPHIAELVKKRPRDFETVNIHEAQKVVRQFGRKLTDRSLDLKNPPTSLKWRRSSYPQTWAGPPPDVMAMAGLFYHDSDDNMEFATCYICDVTYRFPKGGNLDPWKEHKLAHDCLHLARYKSGGPNETPEAKRPRYNSESAASDMMERERAE